jgi:hypothetical protein
MRSSDRKPPVQPLRDEHRLNVYRHPWVIECSRGETPPSGIVIGNNMIWMYTPKQSRRIRNFFAIVGHSQELLDTHLGFVACRALRMHEAHHPRPQCREIGRKGDAVRCSAPMIVIPKLTVVRCRNRQLEIKIIFMPLELHAAGSDRNNMRNGGLGVHYLIQDFQGEHAGLQLQRSTAITVPVVWQIEEPADDGKYLSLPAGFGRDFGKIW